MKIYYKQSLHLLLILILTCLFPVLSLADSNDPVAKATEIANKVGDEYAPQINKLHEQDSEIQDHINKAFSPENILSAEGRAALKKYIQESKDNAIAKKALHLEYRKEVAAALAKKIPASRKEFWNAFNSGNNEQINLMGDFTNSQITTMDDLDKVIDFVEKHANSAKIIGRKLSFTDESVNDEFQRLMLQLSYDIRETSKLNALIIERSR